MHTRVRLSRFADPLAAELLAARLRGEGIDARVRSEATGPYRFTVGLMAEAEVWVPDDQLAAAQEVALAAEVDDTLGRAQAWQPDRPATKVGDRVVAAVALGLLLGLFVIRALVVLA